MHSSVPLDHGCLKITVKEFLAVTDKLLPHLSLPALEAAAGWFKSFDQRNQRWLGRHQTHRARAEWQWTHEGRHPELNLSHRHTHLCSDSQCQSSGKRESTHPFCHGFGLILKQSRVFRFDHRINTSLHHHFGRLSELCLSVYQQNKDWLIWYRELNVKTQHRLIIAGFPYVKSDYGYETKNVTDM